MQGRKPVTVKRRTFLALGALAVLPCCGTPSKSYKLEVPTRVWGKAGRRNGEFVKPRAINLSQGEVYVVDTTGRVQVFTEDGEYTRQWSVPEFKNGTPTSIAFDREGRIYLPDTHYSRILVYTRQGELLDTWGSYGTGSEQFIYPTSMVQGPDGLLYFSEYGEGANRIHVFDEAQHVVRQWGEFGEAPGQFNRAMDITVDKQGKLCVVDTGNCRVERFETDGRFLGVIGKPGTEPGELKDPFTIALARDGSLLVCEYGNHRVSQFTVTGQFLRTYGGPGHEPGQFSGPRGVAISAVTGAMYVADTGNDRVQRFDIEVHT